MIDDRKLKRQLLEAARAGRMAGPVDRSSAWYRRWAMRADRSKYSPNDCQRAEKV